MLIYIVRMTVFSAAQSMNIRYYYAVAEKSNNFVIVTDNDVPFGTVMGL